jgi:hypothetical protein
LSDILEGFACFSLASNCGTPPTKNNTKLSSQNNAIGDSVDYQCQPGYEGNGKSPTINCQMNAKWTKSGFKCLRKF